MPISVDMKTGTATVLHRGGRLDGEFVANWTSGALWRSRSARKAMSPPNRRQAAPMKPVRGPSSDGVLVGGEDGLFISGPAFVETRWQLERQRVVSGPFERMACRLLSELDSAMFENNEAFRITACAVEAWHDRNDLI